MTRAVFLDRGRVMGSLLPAAACAAGALCVYLAAFHVGPVADADRRIYFAFLAVPSHSQSEALNDFLGWLDPARYALLALIPPAVALLRGRPRLAVAAVALMAGASLTTDALKEITGAEHFPYPTQTVTWPSGHMTAGAALALALVLVVPGRWRPGVAVGAVLWVGAVAAAILLLGRHLLSDVVTGLLVAGAWAALAVAGLRAWPAPADAAEGDRRLLRPLAAAAGLAVAVGAIAAALANDVGAGPIEADPIAIAAGALVVAGLVVAIVGATAVSAGES
jgi:membrane-associated phospholipid phosphatase